MGNDSKNDTRKNRKHGEEPLVSNIFRLCRHLQVSKDFIQLDRNATLRRLQGNKRSRLKKDGPLALYCSSVLKGECSNFTIPPTSVVSVREDNDIKSEGSLISERKEQQDNVRVADHEYDSSSEISQIERKLRSEALERSAEFELDQSWEASDPFFNEEFDLQMLDLCFPNNCQLEFSSTEFVENSFDDFYFDEAEQKYSVTKRSLKYGHNSFLVNASEEEFNEAVVAASQKPHSNETCLCVWSKEISLERKFLSGNEEKIKGAIFALQDLFPELYNMSRCDIISSLQIKKGGDAVLRYAIISVPTEKRPISHENRCCAQYNQVIKSVCNAQEVIC